MSGRRTKTAIVGAVLCGLAAPALAGTTSKTTVQDLQAQVASLKAQVAQMRQDQDQNWLNQRRKQEVKNLIKDVLSDAKTRSSLLQEGQMAGISENGKIFLRSADGSFEFSPSGMLQVRYIYNNRDKASNSQTDANGNSIDQNVGGFQLRRARFIGQGHIGSPKIGYYFQLTGDNNSSSTMFDDYYLDYHFGNGLTARAGRFKQPFSREYLTSAANQLAVERSVVNNYFAVARSQGVQLAYKTDKIMLRGALNNGSKNTYNDFNASSNPDVAFTGRVDYKVTGDWSQLADSFNAWSGNSEAIFVGGAVDYEVGQTGTAGTSAANSNYKTLKYTADASIQQNGMSAFVAGYGENTDNNLATQYYDTYGVEAQVAYFMVPDKIQPFARYEGIFFDHNQSVTTHNANLITVGFNWYQHKQSAKFTLDGVYAFNPLDNSTTAGGSLADTGAGLLTDGSNQSGQFAIRAQYQLLF